MTTPADRFESSTMTAVESPVASALHPGDILEIRGLRKSFGDGEKRHEVIRGLDLSIARGECFALLGPNGAGKTTTLRLCLGLTAPDAGTIHLGGLPVPVKGREARIRVGVVPQIDNLDPDFTVAENLLIYGRYFGLPDTAIRSRIPSLLEFASLTSKRDAKIGELSGGMKRRLTLARSLVNDPDVIFMDEPTTGLDPQAPASDLGPAEEPAGRRQDHPADDPLHGRGRTTRRPSRRRRRRCQDCRGARHAR